VRVHVRREGSHALLEVSDDGIGIPPDLLPHVFDLFAQGSRGLDRAQGGLGIGLTLVHRLAVLHGGTATAESPGDDRGSTFTVRMPAIEAPREIPAATTAAAGPASSRRRVVIVEDNIDAREMMALILRNDGHEVHEAVDGPSGLEAVLSVRPDVAFIDVGLPILDGYELVRRVRAAGGAQPVLVALTGYALPEDRRRAMEAGFDEHLAKPVDPKTIERILRTAPLVEGRSA
jgi:CheY-like chemotaxis protein